MARTRRTSSHNHHHSLHLRALFGMPAERAPAPAGLVTTSTTARSPVEHSLRDVDGERLLALAARTASHAAHRRHHRRRRRHRAATRRRPALATLTHGSSRPALSPGWTSRASLPRALFGALQFARPRQGAKALKPAGRPCLQLRPRYGALEPAWCHAHRLRSRPHSDAGRRAGVATDQAGAAFCARSRAPSHCFRSTAPRLSRCPSPARRSQPAACACTKRVVRSLGVAARHALVGPRGSAARSPDAVVAAGKRFAR